MAANERTLKALQLLASCFFLALSFEDGTLVLAKPSVAEEQSPWKPLSQTTKEIENDSNRIPVEKDFTNNTTNEKKEDDRSYMSKRFTIIRDNLAHGFGGRHCLENAIHICDLRDLATLISPAATPCSLIRDFHTCVAEETALCLDPDVILLKTSLTSLMRGFHANGKCHQVPVMFQDALLTDGEVEECKPEVTWACALQLVSDLQEPHVKTCNVILQFRNCIRSRTLGCEYMGARFLVEGAQGLVWIYKKAGYCKLI